ncbi:hypothetical protein IC744_00100 [Microbacterium hominis]|uniref:hypothetical protein n=1 Tax=Microbacterium TaxID=33882 RepID=UPI00168B39FE|nr:MULTISPECIES: hypothetical protein [Microbacterium]QOC24860.1 hypothetical protein IC745_10745 [Microbacterium hominis]QOC28913.1 hypothetical protein IC744_00100 [Microbacterium hominis]QYF98888.1 hypothetical protein KY498_06650 [Microbacterium sp. PAMC21962]
MTASETPPAKDAWTTSMPQESQLQCQICGYLPPDIPWGKRRLRIHPHRRHRHDPAQGERGRISISVGGDEIAVSLNERSIRAIKTKTRPPQEHGDHSPF